MVDGAPSAPSFFLEVMMIFIIIVFAVIGIIIAVAIYDHFRE